VPGRLFTIEIDSNHIMAGSTGVMSFSIAARNSGPSVWPWAVTSCHTASSMTSSCVPAMVTWQFASLGVVRQSIITLFIISPPLCVLNWVAMCTRVQMQMQRDHVGLLAQSVAPFQSTVTTVSSPTTQAS